MRYLRKGNTIFPNLWGSDEEEEDEDEGGSGGSDSGKGGAGSGRESDESEDDDDTSDDEEEDEDPGEDTSALKKALEAERKERKRLAKEAKELAKYKKKVEAKNKTEVEQAKDAATEAAQEAEKWRSQYFETQLNFAIQGAAQKARFRDTDDALRLIDRSEIEIDEDDGTFDAKAVEKAVKALAENKPHLVLPEGEELPPSGSKFGGKKKADKKASEEALKKKYKLPK